MQGGKEAHVKTLAVICVFQQQNLTGFSTSMSHVRPIALFFRNCVLFHIGLFNTHISHFGKCMSVFAWNLAGFTADFMPATSSISHGFSVQLQAQKQMRKEWALSKIQLFSCWFVEGGVPREKQNHG